MKTAAGDAGDRRVIRPDPGSRWVLVAVAMVVVAVLLGGRFFYRTQEREQLHGAEADLLTIAALKVDQIAAWRAERLGDAAVLTEDPLTSEAAARWLEDPTDRGRSELLAHFRSLREHYLYQDVQLVDSEGRVRLSLDGAVGRLAGPTLEGLADAWDRRRPVLVDLHVSPAHRAPVTEAIAPVFSTDGDRQPAGAVVLQSDAQQFLYPLIQSWPGPSDSAETLLVRRDGDYVLFLNDLRHKPDSALALRIPMSQSDLPAVMAVRGQEGIVHGVDYRGVHVLAALERVPGSEWYMVAKIDQREALAGWRRQSILILVLLLGLGAAGVAVIGVVWQAGRRAHFQELFETEAARRALEARHRVTLMSVDEGVIVTDGLGSVELMNPVAEQITGWSSGEATGRPVGDVLALLDERARDEELDPVRRVLRGEPVDDLNGSLLLVARDGREVAITESFAAIPDDRGGVSGVVVVFRDQTEERLARRFTETRLALIEFARDHTLDELLVRAIDEVGAFSESPIGFFHFVLPDQKTLALQQWSTRTVEEFCQAEGEQLHYDIDQAGVWVDCVRERRPVVHNDYATLPHRRGLPDGHAEVVRELVAPVLRDDKVVAVLGVGNKPEDYTPADVDIVAYLADVTWQIVEQKRAEETIRAMAYHDPLTGLPNRLLFSDRLGLAIAEARRRGSSLALVMLDVDRFKDVNDTHGHEVGDRVLQVAGERLSSLVRETDTVARIGGDEFCLLLPGLARAEDAVTAARKILTGFAESIAFDGVRLEVTASLGVAMFPVDGEDETSLMRSADRAMYRAKRAGRNTYRCAPGSSPA